MLQSPEKRIFQKKSLCALLALIICFSALLSGCTGPQTGPGDTDHDHESSYNRLTAGVYADPIPERKADADFYDAVKNFSSDLMIMSIHGTENVAISPLALMDSLLLFSNGASSVTETEILQLFSKKISRDRFNEYMATYTTELEQKENCGISSSFWINHSEKNFCAKDSFLKLNANYYLTDGFSFDGTTVNASTIINNWLANESELYDLSIPASQTVSASSITTLSGVYGEMKWVLPFVGSEKGVFNTPAGETTVNYMHSSENQLLSLGNATGFVKTMTNGCKVAAIIPKEGVKLSAVVELIDFVGISQILNYTAYTQPFNVRIPEFKYNKITDVTEILGKCGLNRALSSSMADFSGLCDYATSLYLSNVLSAVSVTFGSLGVSAGAPSSTPLQNPETDEKLPTEITIDYNHPFIYIVYDANDVPLFIGNVVQP